MPVTVKNVSEVLGKDVFTTKGVYAGRVADLEMHLDKFRIKSIVVEAGKGSFLASMVGGKRGVIIPYQLVESVGDVVIIKHIVAPAPIESGQFPMEEPALL